MNTPRNHRSGYTLSEVMVASTVVSLLLMMMIPLFVGMLGVAKKTSGVLANTDALREFSTKFAGDLQSASNFSLMSTTGTALPTVVDNGSNHVQLVYTDPTTNAVTALAGYYVDTSAGGSGPWPVRRYRVESSTAPDLTSATVRNGHEILGKVTPVITGQLFYRLANRKTVFVNANVITPGPAQSKAINSLRLAVSLR